ncbi:MAG: SPFH/Band 7/PHB domain protein [Anaerolineales bacterium]|nr:SPFH/Band 7/PHB domain protein [Anaerolineales bacterium]
MLENLFDYSIIGLLVLFGIIIINMAVRIVPEYKRLVIFRLGRCIGPKGPGLIFLIPFIDKPVDVDLREVYFDVPPQTCITADNASVSIDFIVYDKVIDPIRSVLEVEDFTGAARGLAITTLRAVVGAMDLDDVLSKRDEINQVLHEKLDQVTDRWGIRIMAVEIREVVPPKAIEEAMTRQMAAERNRRAMVAEADGKKEAAVAVAKGDKQAAILQAEGQREASILEAEGFSLALEKIFEVAKELDSKTLTLQYLEALKDLGANASTKFIIPTELMNLAKPISDIAKNAHSRES